jgi:uncharacterized protein YecE (DUF72 family)
MKYDTFIKVGCCGFPCSRKRYYENFDVIEIQKTFYNPPRIETAEKWRSDAPKNFEFTLKAWQLITHPKESPTYRKAKLNLSEIRGREENFVVLSTHMPYILRM